MTPLSTIVFAGIALIVCVILFRYEDVQGRRFFARTRARLDVYISLAYKRIASIRLYAGPGLFRRQLRDTFQYLAATLVVWLQVCERALLRFVGTERRRALRAEARKNGEASVLDEIKAHKESMSLSPEEQKRVKEESIGGKL